MEPATTLPGLLGIFKQRTRTGIWLFMIAAAFTLTHVPPPKTPFPPLAHDKVLHVTGFTGLSFFTFWRLAVTKSPLSSRAIVLWYAALLAYAAFDEITQPLTGRSCELSDWLADSSGAVIGTSIVYCWHSLVIAKAIKKGESA